MLHIDDHQFFTFAIQSFHFENAVIAMLFSQLAASS